MLVQNNMLSLFRLASFVIMNGLMNPTLEQEENVLEKVNNKRSFRLVQK